LPCSTMSSPRATPAQKPRGLASRTSMIRASMNSGRPIAAPAETVEDQQCGADRERAIADVESRIVPTLPMEKQEVDPAAERQSMPEIAERATEDEGE